MNNIIYGFLLTTIAGFSTMIGTILVFTKKNEKILISSLAFAAGVMLCVSLTDLIPESVELISLKYNIVPTILISLIFIVIGIIVSSYINIKLPIENKNGLYKVGIFSMLAIILHNIPEGIATFLASTSDMALGIALTIAIALHNIPEGMAVGVAFAGLLTCSIGVTLAGAFALAIGIAIQNIPEGAIISMPLHSSGKGKFKSFVGGVLSGVVEPIGAIITIMLTQIVVPILPYLLSFAAGAMIYVVVAELIPESQSDKRTNSVTIAVAIGFVIMMLLDVALG